MNGTGVLAIGLHWQSPQMLGVALLVAVLVVVAVGLLYPAQVKLLPAGWRSELPRVSRGLCGPWDGNRRNRRRVGLAPALCSSSGQNGAQFFVPAEETSWLIEAGTPPAPGITTLFFRCPLVTPGASTAKTGR